VELGAVVVTRTDFQPTPGSWSVSWPVLGRTVLERWVERLSNSGAGVVSVAPHDTDGREYLRMMTAWARAGVERILLITLGSYAEIDVVDLLHFHHHGRNQVTQVFDQKGALGVSLHERGAILTQCRRGRFHPPPAGLSRYDFSGYVTRLSSTVAYHQLVQDALQGRCEIRPMGQPADERVWVDPSADVHPSVKIEAPCYVGANARLRAGVSVRAYSSVERNCEIDVGTTLDRACVLPDTYLASGLLVRNSIVDGTRLEHLGQGITVDLGQAGLSARRPPCAPRHEAVRPRLQGTRRICIGRRGA
jgi:hypothetical protein